MNTLTEIEYTRQLEKFCKSCEKYLYAPINNPNIISYGTGESYHWAVQANMTAFSALAVLSTSKYLDENNIGISREELQDRAIKMLRYSIQTHKTGTFNCTDNQKWGLSWISGLSLERMRHGYEAIEPLLNQQDLLNMRKIMESESTFLLDEYEIKAGFGFYENKPESNIWNGAQLLRTATYYPDFDRKTECLEKAIKFFANGISIPSDVTSILPFGTSTVKDLHVGANFTENYSLNHHDYMNVGYAALTLSNIGFLHFSFKNQGYNLPQEVYFHAKELWENLKRFFFHDGRIIRCGGDSRIRYSYCQDYAVPAWLFAYDKFKDEDALEFEKKWFDIIKFESSLNADCSFLSTRLENIKKSSPFYYTRLEGDRAVSCSFGLYWREKGLLNIPKKIEEKKVLEDFWHDDFHGATISTNEKRIASWCWKGEKTATGIFVPTFNSNMAEWEHNLSGKFITSNIAETKFIHFNDRISSNTFSTCGKIVWTEKNPLGEGEREAVFAEHVIAFITLPDGESSIVIQYAQSTRRIFLHKIQGLNLMMPNDIFNNLQRKYYSDGKQYVIYGIPEKEEVIKIPSPYLNIDGKLTLVNFYGGNGFTIYRPNKRQIGCTGFPHTSLYCDEICTEFSQVYDFVNSNTTLLDNATLLTCNNNLTIDTIPTCNVFHNEKYPTLKMLKVNNVINKNYFIIVNFGEYEVNVDLKNISTLSCKHFNNNIVLKPLQVFIEEV